jgi:hypothetical protein
MHPLFLEQKPARKRPNTTNCLTMYRLTLVLVLLLALPFSGSTATCKLQSVLRAVQVDDYNELVSRQVSCLHLTSKKRLAVCLLQRNSVAKLMECTDWDPTHVLNWTLHDRDLLADSLDLIPRDDHCSEVNANGNDDMLKVTPRGILMAAAWACAELGSCDKSLANSIAKCPYNTFQEFQACLCCELVEQDDINFLEHFIRGADFSGISHEPEEDEFKLYCGGACGARVADKLRIFRPRPSPPMKRRADPGHDYTFTMTGGKPTQRPSRTAPLITTPWTVSAAVVETSLVDEPAGTAVVDYYE